MEVQLRSERRAGELLKRMEKHEGGRPQKTGNTMLPVSSPKLKDLGIDKMESVRWQKIAGIPADKFEDYIARTQRKTQASLLMIAVSTSFAVPSQIVFRNVLIVRLHVIKQFPRLPVIVFGKEVRRPFDFGKEADRYLAFAFLRQHDSLQGLVPLPDGQRQVEFRLRAQWPLVGVLQHFLQVIDIVLDEHSCQYATETLIDVRPGPSQPVIGVDHDFTHN